MAADGGYVRNLEDKRGKPGRWVIGDPLPESADLLPDPAQLATADTTADMDGCAVALESEGENDEHDRAVQTAMSVVNGHIIDDQPSKPRSRRRG